MKKALRYILAIVALALPCTFAAAQDAAAEEGGDDDLNVTELIFEHTGDAYEWHLTNWGSTSVSIPLPVIVRSKVSGWHCFSARHLRDGATYEGFSIAPEGEKYEGKVVETVDGQILRPFDISITKTVLALIINSILLLVIILTAASWYRRHDVRNEAPKGLAALLEPVIVMIEDEVIRPSVGEDYARYSPYLLTAFFFILINNLMGIVPFFPGGGNVTGNIAVTVCLAVFTFLAVNLFGNRHYWKDILWPDVPIFLKAFPLMPVIEIIGMFTKPFSLAIRLFANIFAGHAMILGMVCVIFVTAKMGLAINGSLTVVSVLLGVFMDCLEILVAFIQAYVFTMLSSVFIGMSRQKE